MCLLLTGTTPIGNSDFHAVDYIVGLRNRKIRLKRLKLLVAVSQSDPATMGNLEMFMRFVLLKRILLQLFSTKKFNL